MSVIVHVKKTLERVSNLDDSDYGYILKDPYTGIEYSLLRGPWLHFNGSFGDLFYISSCLHASELIRKGGVRILSPAKYKDLLRVFMGKKWMESTVVFHEDHLASEIRNNYFFKFWRWRNRHLIPYNHETLWRKDMMFSPLLCDHASLAILVDQYKIKYLDAVQVILDCKENFVPMMPQYSQEDRNRVEELISGTNTKDPKSLLYFPVNYSNKPLTDESFANLIKALRSLGFKISFNVHDADEDTMIDTIHNLSRKLTDKDNLLIYYAGHGELDENTNKGYFLPIDALNRTKVSNPPPSNSR